MRELKMNIKTIEVEKQFFEGTKTINFDDYTRTWKNQALQLYTFAIDFGDDEDLKIMQDALNQISILSRKAFDKIYNEQNK